MADIRNTGIVSEVPMMREGRPASGAPVHPVSDLVNVSLVRVQASTVGVTEVTQKKEIGRAHV